MSGLLCLMLLTGANTLVAGQSKIVEGAEVLISNYPYEVYMQTNMRGCSGSIIGPTWVITTAACLDGATQISIRAGSANRLSGGSTHTGYITFIHPQYTSGAYDYDYGLVVTWPPFPLGALGYSAVKLPWYPPLPGTIAWASGWGCASISGSMSTYPREAQMIIISNQMYYPDIIITPRILWALPINGSAYSGGCGDPLVNKSTGELYGMALWCKNNCNGPVGFANVASQRFWIYSITGI